MHTRAESKDRNEENMEDTIKIRKDKIKNVAIVFLSAMLALTFFSNSILNRALPEVATAYVEYNTITEKVRGSGVVTADDPYKVVVKDTRTIESVAIKVGDEVTKDQILFYLEDAESEELKDKESEVEAKEEELNKQVLEYMTSILSVDISNLAYHNIQNDNIASVAAYQSQIEATRQQVENAQSTVDSLNRQILISSMDSEDDIDRDTELALATANRDSASKRMSEAQAQISSAEAIIASLGGSIGSEGDGGTTEGNPEGDSPAEGGSLEVKALEAATAYNAAKAAYDSAKSSLITTLSAAVSITVSENEPLDTPQAQEVPAFVESDYFGGDGFPKGTDALVALQAYAEGKNASEAFNTFKNAYDTYLTTKAESETATKNLSDYNTAKSTLSSAKSALSNATNEYNSYQAKIDSLTKENAESAGDNSELQNQLKVSLADAEAVLSKAKKEQEQLLKDISSELALSSKNEDIAKTEEELSELKEELEDLKSELTDAVVTAPVEGTIISINKVAGESTVPQEAVATIQVAGKGMSLSFSVTNAQAAKVNVGDKAELQNAWYYNDVMITLSKIKPDPEDPGKKKLLEFMVEGAVQSGESLSVSVGQRSAEYEHVVPNSAVREDNKGKFILIIDEKTTPFGNRYKARRVDVEVLASDEINTAVSADLQGYEYVITTSNQPVKAGDQVRLNG